MANPTVFLGRFLWTPGRSGASLALAMACCSASLVAPSQAQACTTVFEPAYVGFPAEGDSDVPTDVQLTFDSSSLWSRALEVGDLQAVLTSSTGASISAVVDAPYVYTYTVTPTTELEPNTLYSFTISWTDEVDQGSWTIQFTTGAGPFTGTPAPPNAASLQHYRLTNDPADSCSPPPSGTCVALPERTEVERRMIDDIGQQHQPYLERGPFFTNLSGIDQGTPFTCVELRTRAPNGTVSEPVTLCGRDTELLDLSDESDVVCTPEGIPVDEDIPDEGIPVDEGRACSVSATPGSRGEPLAFLAMLALLRWTRRARKQ